MTKKKSRHLMALLIKENFKNPEEVLEEPGTLTRYELKTSLPFKGTLFLQSPRKNPPPWLEFIQNGVSKPIELLNASNSGILFIESSSRILAFTFGHGRYLLNQNCFEKDFGLKVTLNSVNPDRLRSVDMRTFEELPVHTRRQASVSSSLDIFGLDIDRDLLRAVTGEPRDMNFAQRVAGSDAFAFNAKLDFADLGAKCKQILRFYASKEYRKHFPWIEHIQPIREPLLKEKLDNELANLLTNNKLANIYLAPPEPLEWENVEGFYYSSGKAANDPYADLDIDCYLKTLQDDIPPTIEALKNHRVKVKYTEIDEPAPKWSIYECLVLQILLDEYLYVLTSSQWYQVEKSFALRIFKDVKRIPTKDKFLTPARKDEAEGEYNKRAANMLNGFVLMDRKNIRCDGAATEIEFCDLFSRNKELIHVKKKTRSATLSHLFEQGCVSAQLFLRDDTFRIKVRAILENQRPNLRSLVPKNRPKTLDYEIIYAIITDGNKKWPDCLPFFSQLSVREHAQRLRELGYKVSLARIVEE